MLHFEQFVALERDLDRHARPHGIVASARLTHKEDGEWLEIRAETWRNHHFECHTQLVPVAELFTRGTTEIAERSVAFFHALFSPPAGASGGAPKQGN